MTQVKNNKTILVIEDEPFLNRILVKALKKEGFEVDTAANGRIAMDMVHMKEYDIYFSDIRIPEMSGIDFYKQFKKDNPELANRVILSSGDLLSNDVKTFLNETDVRFLAKPFTPDELTALLREVLS